MPLIPEDACLSSGCSEADGKARGDTQRTILVMFLGGCTFSEISALRFLGKEKGNKDLLLNNELILPLGRLNGIAGCTPFSAVKQRSFIQWFP